MTAYKGLTLEEIVECFIDPSNKIDSQLLNIFLYTYRNYCSSMDVIILMNKRLKQLGNIPKFPESKLSEQEGFAKAVIFFINSWLTFPFAFDFYELPDYKSINYLLKKIRIWPQKISFIKKSQDFIQSFQRIEEKINTVLVEFNNVEENIESNFRELPVDCLFGESFQINSQKENKSNCSFIDYSTEIIANCFTYLDQKVLKNLKLQEMLDHIRRKHAPSVTAVIDNYNKLYNVVSLTVNEPTLAWKRFDQYQYSGRNSPVSQENFIPFDYSPLNIKKSDQMYEVINKWIQIAQILNEMLNFSSLMAILTALDNPSNISIMKKTSRLYNQYQSLMKTNEVHISQNKESKKLSLENSSNQSNASNKSKGKLKNLKILYNEVPYLGKHLKNLTYIDDGFSDYLKPSANIYNGNEEQLINLDKCRRQFDVLVQVKLCISAFKSTKIQTDESFLNWYSEIQREHKKSEPRILLTGSTLSLESQKSDSGGSNVSCSTVNQYFKPRPIQYHSHQNLMETTNRFRSQSSPVQSDKITNNKEILKSDSLNCKVATVKLKHPKCAENHDNYLYGSTSYLQISKGYKKHETISNGALHHKNRPRIINRSSSTVHTDGNDPHHLENILYKKIQINENEHTADFIVRVFEKFGIQYADSSNFEVIQILENNKEIIIPENANVFYALAEQKQYLIDIQPKRLKDSLTKL